MTAALTLWPVSRLEGFASRRSHKSLATPRETIDPKSTANWMASSISLAF
ncbi:hypothetical protein I41_37780 [Lacipirellula limnantheis]|uniref:Uncharacterized protein n=1 Tax=Lacipirellula limnantheis TaxID=2528024 RepID=A0A517U1T0_9BACT|nr:hypothetical protein I41_37780 [Lacipirellula limnantheis]